MSDLHFFLDEALFLISQSLDVLFGSSEDLHFATFGDFGERRDKLLEIIKTISQVYPSHSFHVVVSLGLLFRRGGGGRGRL